MSAWLKQIGLTLGTLGPWGVALAALADSFVPLPHVVDAMVVLFSYQTGRPALFAIAAIAGSTVGSLAFYGLCRGGARLARGQGQGSAVAKWLPGWMRRNDFVLVAVAGMLPPPFPFKAVVLPAGAARLSPGRFVGAVALARTLRYGLEAWLAAYYGQWVLQFMKHNYPMVALGFVALLVVTALVVRHTRAAHT